MKTKLETTELSLFTLFPDFFPSPGKDKFLVMELSNWVYHSPH